MKYGTGDTGRWQNAGTAQPGQARSLDLGEARWLQFTYEASGECAPLFPPGLHPTTPVLTTIQLWDVHDGDLGSFRLAQLRLSCRAGVRIRALLVRSVIDPVTAGAALSQGWGYESASAEISLSWRTDQVEAVVREGDREVLNARMILPMPLDPKDLQHISNVNPANVEGENRLLQVEPQLRTLQVQRGRPELVHFDAEFWRVPKNPPKFPVIAASADVGLTLPPVRFIQDPAIPAHKGTVRIESAPAA